MMNTILVIYTDEKISSSAEIGRMKKYSFNTDDYIIEGDMLRSNNYTTNMQVVKVLDKAFKYFNRQTGELSDEFSSTEQWLIRTLVVRQDQEEVVYASKIEEA